MASGTQAATRHAFVCYQERTTEACAHKDICMLQFTSQTNVTSIQWKMHKKIVSSSGTCKHALNTICCHLRGSSIMQFCSRLSYNLRKVSESLQEIYIHVHSVAYIYICISPHRHVHAPCTKLLTNSLASVTHDYRVAPN